MKKETNLVPAGADQAVAQARTQLNGARRRAQELVIKTADHLADATDLLSKVKAVAKEIAAKKAEITKPLNLALRAVRNLFAPVEDACAEAEQVIKGKMVDYQRAVDEAARAKEERIIERVQDGELSVRKAEAALERIEQAPTRAAGCTGVVQFKTIKDFEVEDKARLPLDYLEPDLVKIRRAVIAGIEVPGVRVFERKVVAAS